MKIIHVNQHIIKSNRKHGEQAPPIIVKQGKRGKSAMYHTYEFTGSGRVVYSPDKPLSCGATVWIELND